MLKHGFWVVPDIADAARDVELEAAARRKRLPDLDKIACTVLEE